MKDIPDQDPLVPFLGDVMLLHQYSACLSPTRKSLGGLESLFLPSHGIERPTGPGGGAPSKSGSNVPTPWVPSVPRHARLIVLTLGGVFGTNFNLGS